MITIMQSFQVLNLSMASSELSVKVTTGVMACRAGTNVEVEVVGWATDRNVWPQDYWLTQLLCEKASSLGQAAQGDFCHDRCSS